jgi:hypothetical protein
MFDYIHLENKNTSSCPSWWCFYKNKEEKEQEEFEIQLQVTITKLKDNIMQKNVEINNYNNIISEHFENGKKYLNDDLDEERASAEARLLEEAQNYRTSLIKKREILITLRRDIQKCIDNSNTSITLKNTSDTLQSLLENTLNIKTIDEIQVKMEMNLKEVDDINKTLSSNSKKKTLQEMFRQLPTLQENVKIKTINNNNEDSVILL